MLFSQESKDLSGGDSGAKGAEARSWAFSNRTIWSGEAQQHAEKKAGIQIPQAKLECQNWLKDTRDSSVCIVSRFHPCQSLGPRQ